MSDFIIPGDLYDYTDFIESKEDLELFNQLKEVMLRMKGVPAKDCVEDIILATNLDRKLRKMKPLKVIFQRPDQN